MTVPISTTNLAANDPAALQAMYNEVFASDPRMAALNSAWAALLGVHCEAAQGNLAAAQAYVDEVVVFAESFGEPRSAQLADDAIAAYGLSPRTLSTAPQVSPDFAPAFAPASVS